MGPLPDFDNPLRRKAPSEYQEESNQLHLDQAVPLCQLEEVYL